MTRAISNVLLCLELVDQDVSKVLAQCQAGLPAAV